MNDLTNAFEQALEEARSDATLSDIDIGYIKECIDSQLDNLLDTSSKKNYLKRLRKRLEDDQIDKEYANAICGDLYSEVVDKISRKLNFDIDKTEDRIDEMANALYKFFVIHHTSNVVYFIESAIDENQKQIISELQSREGTVNRHIEGINSKISLILNNLSDVIDIISGMNFTFDDYLKYIDMHDEAKSSIVKMKEYAETCMDNTDEILPMIIRSLLDESEGFGTIYNDLQRNIYQRYNK